MKPDWRDAPDFAQYLAMDSNGMWTWFELEPEWESQIWGEPSIGEWCLSSETASGGKWSPASDAPDESGIDWDFGYDTLEKRP